MANFQLWQQVAMIISMIALLISSIIYFIYVILNGAVDFKDEIEFHPEKTEVRHERNHSIH